MMKKTKTKKTKPREIPDSYTFTDDDHEWYWANFDRICTTEGPAPDVTEAELDLFDTVNQADRLKSILKRWPTMKELREYWKQEAEEQARKRAKTEADWEERKLRAAQK